MSWFTSALPSPALAISAQDRLLRYFIRRSTFEVRSSSNHELNYIVIRKHNPYPKNHIVEINKHYKPKEKTLVLMHGFGLGLGCFYGK